MASQLQGILRSLCCRTEWCYAVFWKLNHEMLKWEAGYCKHRELQTFALSSEIRPSDKCIETVVNKTAYQTYHMGDGILGQVAFSKNHQWISKSRNREHPTELHEQFAAGIQTVAVIAVHQGVVQLGSMNVIAEDMTFIGHVKSLFSKDEPASEGTDEYTAESEMEETLTTIPQTMLEDETNKYLADMSHFWSGLADKESGVITTIQDHAILEACGSDEQQASDLLPSYLGRHMASLPDHEFGADAQSLHSQTFMADGQTSENNASEGDQTFLTSNIVDCSVVDMASTALATYGKYGCTSQIEISRHRVAPIEAGLELTDNIQNWRVAPYSIFESQAHAEGMLIPFPSSSAHNSSVLENSTSIFCKAGNLNGCSSGTLSYEYLSILNGQTSDINLGECDIVDLAFTPQIICSQDQKNSYAFQKHDALHSSAMDILFDGPLQRACGFELDELDNSVASVSKGEDVHAENKPRRCQSSNPTHSDEASALQKPSNGFSGWQLPSFWDHGCLQPNFSCNNIPNQKLGEGMWLTTETDMLRMAKTRAIESSDSNDLPVTGHGGSAKEIRALLANTELGAFNHKSLPTPVSPGDLTLQGVLSLGEPSTTRSNKKRTRQGDKSMKRPKDRQRIQDCLHELRSIIPRSGKCSIDALLGKTIKYMRFLHSMAEDAGLFSDDNIDSKVQIDERDHSRNSNDRKNGASWALELNDYGGFCDFCPVFIEDLKRPHQMSVQMLCEEEGLFLEIAQTLRSLGLKILRGEMESKDKKAWAHFVIKANGHVHRIHIMRSLMRLLDSNARPTSGISHVV